MRPCAASTSASNSSLDLAASSAGAALLGDAGAGSCGRARRRPRRHCAEHVGLRRRVDLRVARNCAQLGTSCDRLARARRGRGDRLDAALPPARPRTGRARTCAGRRPSAVSLPSLERGEVEPLDRLLDQAALVVGVEHLADDALGRLDGEVGDLGADLVDRARGLGLDLPARLLEPPLPLDLGLLLRALELGIGDLARLGEDLRRLVLAPARSGPGAARAARGPRRGRCRPPRRRCGCGRAARRSSSGSGRTRTS